MAYENSTSYMKFQSCDCEYSDSCNCSNDNCGCCPIGTIEVKDSCGKTLGCMLPSDAAQYHYDTIAVPEGYVKATNPNTGEYVGLLTPSEYCAYLTCVSEAGGELLFNINAPATDLGNPNAVTINGNAEDTSVTGDISFIVDRINQADDIVITITSTDGITFTSAATSITIPSDQSFTVDEFEHATGLVAGSYSATFTWVSGTVTKTQAITFVLS